MTYTVHKEGRPFRTCADLNEARECINENGGDGHGAAVVWLVNRRYHFYISKYEEASEAGDDDLYREMYECTEAMSCLRFELLSHKLIGQDGEQWAIK